MNSFRSLSLVLITLFSVSFSQGQDRVLSHSVLDELDTIPRQYLMRAVIYFKDHVEHSDEAAAEKLEQLFAIVGDELRRDQLSSGQVPHVTLTPDLVDSFTANKDRVRGYMGSAARTLKSDEGKALAAHIFDALVAIDKKDVAAAYYREVLHIEEGIHLNWGGDLLNPERSKITAAAPAGGYYTIDFPGLGAPGGGDTIAGVAKSQALIKGLLVQSLSGAQFAGSASQMNATVIGSADRLKVAFNQKVGPSMMQAVEDMTTFLRTRHPDADMGIEVEISFEEQYIAKDGPSAGVACTLMLESLLKGNLYSDTFAVTGALDASGQVGSVGGIDGKVRGAIARGCDVVAIPADNESVVQDLLITNGIDILSKIQIVKIATFDEALAIASHPSERPVGLQQAVETFSEVQKVLASGEESYLKNAKVQGKLREVVQAYPNHLSAKYLLLKGLGREPKVLTLLGSVQAIDRKAAPFINELNEGNFDIKDAFGKDGFADTIVAMNRLRPFLDERTRACADAIVDYSGVIRIAINSPPRSPAGISELRSKLSRTGRAVSREYEELFSRPDVKEELMILDEDEDG